MITGREDFFYRVFYSNPDKVGEFILENDNLQDTSSIVSYTISGLVPFTTYILRVTTHNGVSDQDPDTFPPMCEHFSRTLEGGKL